MPSAQQALHIAVKSKLRNDPKVLDLSWNAEILITDSITAPWRSATFDGMRHQFFLVIKMGEPDHAQAKALSDGIIACLHDADLPLKGHALIELSLRSAHIRTIDDALMCEIDFDAVTISD